jgi:histidinol-phosphate/aromatic aminotransferase/cobyric acid decarboxylase-like protein
MRRLSDNIKHPNLVSVVTYLIAIACAEAADYIQTKCEQLQARADKLSEEASDVNSQIEVTWVCTRVYSSTHTHTTERRWRLMPRDKEMRR